MKNASVCSFGITMLRLTFSLLLVGFVAVSSVPLNEPTTELIPPQTTNKTITLEDVEKNESVDSIRSILSVCSMGYPASQANRKFWEKTLKVIMEDEDFSAFYDQFLKNITATREAECTPGSDPDKFTGKNSGNNILLAFHIHEEPKAQTSTENNQEPSAVKEPKI